MEINRYLLKTEDGIISVVPFGDYDTLPKEYAVVIEDAYGRRECRIVKSDELESLLIHYTPLDE